MIPVRNVYYMLSYAFSALRSRGFADLADEDFENADDLLAAILARGIAQQARRGLKREYIERSEAVRVPRGKIDVSASVKQVSVASRRLVCDVDEFSVNNEFNKILKTAGRKLLASNAQPKRKRELRRVLEHLRGAETVPVSQIQWKQHYGRHDQTYRMLIALSRLILTGTLHGSTAGPNHLEQFDEEDMHVLYERFVREYFRREHGDRVDVRAALVPWALDDGEQGLLPSMRTDVMLTPKDPSCGRVLIIDTKWYADNLQTYYGAQRLRSQHLYQMFAYVKNKEEALLRSGDSKEVSGLLLYAQTDDEKQPLGTHRIAGNEFSVATLDLAANFAGIRTQLDDIVAGLLEPCQFQRP
mgnify:CR=1 FL=1